MTGVRFYLEFPSAAAKKRSGKTHARHSGNVFAVWLNDGNRPLWHSDYRVPGGCYEGLGGVFEWPNSPVASCSVAVRSVLQRMYKRIPEATARKIHPALFERLDSD